MTPQSGELQVALAVSAHSSGAAGRVRRVRADLLHVQYVAPPVAGLPVVAAVHDSRSKTCRVSSAGRTEIRLRLFVRASVRQSAAIVTTVGIHVAID